MRFKTIITGIVAVAVSVPLTAAAQSASSQSDEEKQEQSNAIDKILSGSAGMLEIDIPDDILHLLVSPPSAPKKTETRKEPNLKPGINKIKGYRIQVFADGRNQSTLETRVKMRADAIAARFPKYRGQVYTFSSSPNWYCRVGNFQSQREADAALAELKRAFPAFAGEMRVVNSQIVVIK